ncbi:sugar transferase [Qipengyuania citrea]|uniref:sugar transferase n=1 Tax=Qipengyuania citrea TaxID=225971 RepID=UPI003298826B
MYRQFGKRALDILGAAIALTILSPLLLALAIGVRLSSPGPSLFQQARVGRYGQTFRICKFRSMPADTRDAASDQLGEVHLRPFGKFLRRSNLDELPQLYNILRGDMSFIGPRPSLPSQTDLLELRKQNGALECRPGLTGLAQVNSFDGMSAKVKSRFDGQYATNISLWNDIVVAFKTLGYLAKPPPTY